MDKIGKTVYNSTAAYGRFRATTILESTVVISCLLMVWVVYHLYKKMTTNLTIAKIILPNCRLNELDNMKNSNKIPNLTYNCNLELGYTLDKTYNSYLRYTGNKQYYKGDQVKIAYSKNNRREIGWPVSIWMIIIPILLSIIMVGMSYYNYYMTKTSKDYASIKGSFNIMNNISRLTKKKNNLKNNG
tara:strand:- start:883 stop:1443 length:561 start_codon:yes stop_codon:yes gene_type:complete